MINVATVHYQSAKWVDPQLRYLEEHIAAPYRVFASLEGIEDTSIRSRYFMVSDETGGHADKLNHLGELIVAESDPSDLVVFIDGDAFPIRPLVPWMEETLGSYPLVAVKREENVGDRQPHPCFCVTTVGFWDEIGGDWRRGTWTNDAGREVSDVGGILLNLLDDKGIEWHPLLRSNTNDLHSLYFAIYGGKVYHHGAGFRLKLSRADRQLWPSFDLPPHPAHDAPSVGGELKALLKEPSKAFHKDYLPVAREAVSNTFTERRRKAQWHKREKYLQQNERTSDRIYDQLCRDPYFYRQFES